MKLIKKIIRKLNFLGVKIYLVKGFTGRNKNDYQSKFININIAPGEKVLDIGSGGEPFPRATHLVDLHPGNTQHRYNKLKTDDKIFTQASVEKLPFKNKEFDFIYCAHVLEHVNDPASACREIMRVGERGYIETPTRMSDILFNFPQKKEFHKWHISAVGNTLIFMEYQEFERKNIKYMDFYAMVHSKYANNIKRLYEENKNLFSNMFIWNKNFDYYVFNKDGKLLNRYVADENINQE